ncbi:hypothetical protein QFZ77_007131 [Paenibacillus sp. V4I3]|nr:hypothetical protein [Paenibacillus sp. V4I3]MDQ0878472.1 hypothetical protein [Paenibacillus sp. V4I3]MDQ0885669.1 hypothetical protein [Paenibacillus sp. V4I9]
MTLNENSKLGQIWENPAGRAVILKYLPHLPCVWFFPTCNEAASGIYNP